MTRMSPIFLHTWYHWITGPIIFSWLAYIVPISSEMLYTQYDVPEWYRKSTVAALTITLIWCSPVINMNLCGILGLLRHNETIWTILSTSSCIMIQPYKGTGWNVPKFEFSVLTMAGNYICHLWCMEYITSAVLTILNQKWAQYLLRNLRFCLGHFPIISGIGHLGG